MIVALSHVINIIKINVHVRACTVRLRIVLQGLVLGGVAPVGVAASAVIVVRWVASWCRRARSRWKHLTNRRQAGSRIADWFESDTVWRILAAILVGTIGNHDDAARPVLVGLLCSGYMQHEDAAETEGWHGFHNLFVRERGWSPF